MASIYTLTFESEEMAAAASELIGEEDYLDVWNRIRSGVQIDAQEGVDAIEATASEALWRTQEQVEQQFGPGVADAAFDLPIGEPSTVITQAVQTEGAEDETVYYLVQVSGREMREQTQQAIENQKQQLVAGLVTEQRNGGLAQVAIDPIWRTRVPSQPILDPSFLQPPPTQPAQVPTQPPVVTATTIPEADR